MIRRVSPIIAKWPAFRGIGYAMLAGLMTLGAASPVDAQTSRADQASMRKEIQRGELRKLSVIIDDVQSIQPYKSMDYLGGVEFDSAKFVYRLKFMDGRRVVFVYVDARTGRIIGRSP